MTPSVFVIRRSACGASEVVSDAELSAGVGSITPDGGATDASLTTVPVAPAAIVASTLNTAVPPTARFTSSLMSPEPDAAQLEPAEAVQVQVAPVSDVGRVSVTTAPVTAEGPELVVTIV